MKTASTKSNGSQDLIAAVRTPILFVLTFLAFFLSLVAYREEIYDYTNTNNSRMAHWINCVFTHYDDKTDESFQSVCGVNAKSKLSFPTAMWAFICLSGQAAMVALVYLPTSSVYKIWHKWLTMS
eukprot:gene2180-2606_t